MLDERLQAMIHDLELLAPQDQLQLADHIEQWLEDLEWRRVLNEPGPDALYDAAREEVRQGLTQPLRPEGFAEEECTPIRRSRTARPCKGSPLRRASRLEKRMSSSGTTRSPQAWISRK